MVGLSILLESDHVTPPPTTKTTKVINKVITINNKPTPPASPCSRSSSFCRTSFLDQCFLCKRRLLPCRDIFMYQGDRAFCSEECRCTQIFMDEQTEMNKKTTTKTASPKNSNRREKCSLAAMRSSASATSSPSSRNST
ncbi:hypothetical protein AgCh_032584 [Apium graveolens]